jgi:tetratricopeptide (TPR) repeat protein
LSQLGEAFPRSADVGRLGRRLTESDDAGRGVAAYFRGDLDGCIELLGKAAGDDPRLLATLGAARASRGLLAGDEGEGDVEEARASFRRALAQDAGLKLDDRRFSPRVVAIFEDVRRQSR